MSLKLYYAPGACSLSPHIVLNELGLKADLEKYDFASRKTASGKDLSAINPKGYVPVLELDGGGVLTEGPAIVQYLADRKPEAGLAPAAGTLERYRLQEWLNYITSELHKSFSPLFAPTTPDAYQQTVLEGFKKKFAYLNEHLGKNAYLLGRSFTVADAYAFTVLNWTNFLKIDLSPYANLTAYMARIAARPAVRKALETEGLLQGAAE
jgi:glutathione S-transferase